MGSFYVKISGMILKINTKDQKQVMVSLEDGAKIIDSRIGNNKFGSQILLPLIDKMLKKNKPNLTGIEVETGPGSFTGLRVGVAVANALGFALKVLVNGKKMETKLIYFGSDRRNIEREIGVSS